MQINNKKLILKNPFTKNRPLRSVIVFSLLFVSLFLSGELLYENGAHSVIKLIVQGRFEELPDGGLKDVFNEILDIVKADTTAYSSNQLPTLYLDIPFENMQIIQQKREEALNIGILLASDDDYVAATIRYNDSAPMAVDLRLKGDWTDHLQGDKWSYRIHIKSDGAIEGMRRFSIQAPETRNFIYEWAYHQNLFQEEILAPRYFFVNVVENGENKGIFAVEESFYTELMESQNRRSGVIIRFNENDLWNARADFYAAGGDFMWTKAEKSGYFLTSGYQSSAVTGFGLSGIFESPTLLSEYRTAQEMLSGYQSGKLSASQVFDLDKMGKFLAVSELWGADHGLIWHNFRFYYNPVTNLLEPIGFDGIPMIPEFDEIDLYGAFSHNILLHDYDIANSFYWNAKEIISDEYLSMFMENISSENEMMCNAITSEYGPNNCMDPDKFTTRIDLIKQNLTANIPLVVSAQLHGKNTLEIKLTNAYLFPLSVEDIYLENENMNISPYDNEVMSSGKLYFPGENIIRFNVSDEMVDQLSSGSIMMKFAINGDVENTFTERVEISTP